MKGFTLIETLIYIGLMTMVMGGGVVTAFYLMQTSEINRTALNSEVEAEFLLRKIDWALTGARAVDIISPPPTGEALDVLIGGVLHEITLDTTNLRARISVNGGLNEPLTGERAHVTSMEFKYISGTPPAIYASTTVDGKAYSFTKYIRQ